MRTLSGPYVVLTWSIVGSTREQNGHWKSVNWTMVTGASRLPHIGSLLEMGTGESLSSQAPPRGGLGVGGDDPALAGGAGRSPT